MNAERCPFCLAPVVVSHWNTCPMANRAQQQGPAPDPTQDPLVWSFNKDTQEYEPIPVADHKEPDDA